ncbi:MAG: queuosine precursor transporter [Desulfosoma sp.]|uniref:queuosine precursor transporter n=1 Tax=Desulfosoma sp. TaxID=2603217 RepID=UPI004049B0B8
MQNETQKAFLILNSIFVGSLVIASVLASKIITVFGLVVPAGVLAYCVTFVVTDVISELWGREKANSVVLGGFVALVFSLLLVRLAVVWTPAPFWPHDPAFRTVLDSTSRIIVASFCAYLLSQYHDVWAFHLLRQLTGGKHLWLRNNLSTAVSQLIDTVVFITIAFYRVMPIAPLILGQWVIKLVIAILDTPVVYAVVWLLKACRWAPESSALPSPSTR